MAIQYRVYQNDGSGGPPDLSAPVATVSGLTWDSGDLGEPSDNTFVVVPYDTSGGLACQDVTARVRVLIDAGGGDVTGYPAAPSGLSASPRAGGTAVASWAYPPGGGASGFAVFLWAASGSPDYSAPVATVAADPSSPGRGYAATLAGLADGVAYRVGVRAFNAAGEEANTAHAPVTGTASGPSAVVPVSSGVTV